MCNCPLHFNVGLNINLDCSIVDIINMLIALFGFGFAIYQFWKQNKENREITIDQNNKNWYLSVLVIPHLDRINVFFDSILQSLKELKRTMNTNNLVLRAKEQGEYKDKVSAFLTPIEATMSSYDNSIRESIAELCLALQDEVTKIISDENITANDIENRIMKYKGELIAVLYRPINN